MNASTRVPAAEITGFTGIDDPYEAPLAPELVIGAGGASAVESATQIALLLQRLDVIPGTIA